MALFEYSCPRCCRPSQLDPQGSCVNLLNDKTVCGYEFPLKKYGIANRKVRGKVLKHTTPPTGHVVADYSWTDSASNYALYQLETAKNGSVNLDPNNGFLFLFHAPKGPVKIAKVCYADAYTIAAASGCVIPLNSQLQNMHSHFNNYLSSFIEVAKGPDIVIQHPNVSNSTEYRVFRANQLLFSYDSQANVWQSHT